MFSFSFLSAQSNNFSFLLSHNVNLQRTVAKRASATEPTQRFQAWLLWYSVACDEFHLLFPPCSVPPLSLAFCFPISLSLYVTKRPPHCSSGILFYTISVLIPSLNCSAWAVFKDFLPFMLAIFLFSLSRLGTFLKPAYPVARSLQ